MDKRTCHRFDKGEAREGRGARERLASSSPVDQLAALGKILYLVRCNLVHGSKAEMGDDERIIEASIGPLELLLKIAIDFTEKQLRSIQDTEITMETRYQHIELNEEHVQSIAGTTMKVVELVVEQQAYGWSPEELHFQHPYLTLGQIHSALAYYWDHREELDPISSAFSGGLMGCETRTILRNWSKGSETGIRCKAS